MKRITQKWLLYIEREEKELRGPIIGIGMQELRLLAFASQKAFAFRFVVKQLINNLYFLLVFSNLFTNNTFYSW